MSSGVPTRPAGCWPWSRRDSFGLRRRAGPRQASVAIQPGLMQFTRTRGPSLTARAWVKASRPPLAAA